jgi:hypothetical protein
MVFVIIVHAKSVPSQFDLVGRRKVGVESINGTTHCDLLQRLTRMQARTSTSTSWSKLAMD